MSARPQEGSPAPAGVRTCNLQELVSKLPDLQLEDAAKLMINEFGASIPVPVDFSRNPRRHIPDILS